MPEPIDHAPRLEDYLTEEQRVRLARVLVGVLRSAAENRAAEARAAAADPYAPTEEATA